MLFHYFLLCSMPWFVNDDGELDGLFYLLLIFMMIFQQVGYTHRTTEFSIAAERGGCFQRNLFVCLWICLFDCQHDNF